MLIVALVLAVIGLAALVTAVVTSNELIAWVCIAASVIGVVLLIVDALRERSRRRCRSDARSQTDAEERVRRGVPGRAEPTPTRAETTAAPTETDDRSMPQRSLRGRPNPRSSASASPSSSRTSSSVTWWKSAYTCPTASNDAASSRTPRRRPRRPVDGTPRRTDRNRDHDACRAGGTHRAHARRACLRRWRSRRRR